MHTTIVMAIRKWGRTSKSPPPDSHHAFRPFRSPCGLYATSVLGALTLSAKDLDEEWRYTRQLYRKAHTHIYTITSYYTAIYNIHVYTVVGHAVPVLDIVVIIIIITTTMMTITACTYMHAYNITCIVGQ